MENTKNFNKLNSTKETAGTGTLPFVFKINKPLIAYLKNFSKEDGDINKYLTSGLKKISIDPEDYSKVLEWSDEQIRMYFYFHIECLTFHNLLDKIENTTNLLEKSTSIKQIIEYLLERGYHIFCDKWTESSMILSFTDLNLKNLKNLFSNKPHLEGVQSNLRIRITDDMNMVDSNEENFLNLNSKIIWYGSCTDGRLDVYAKSHILKQILNTSSIKKEWESVVGDSRDDWNKRLEALTVVANTMENDLLKFISFGEISKYTNEKYMDHVDVFINNKNQIPQAIKELKKILVAFQNIADLNSIKNLERLFIQLLGHVEKDVRNEAVIMLNMLYDETNWQEKSQLPIKYKNTGDSHTVQILIRKKDYLGSEKTIVCLTNSPSNCPSSKTYQIRWHEITDVVETPNPNLYKVIFNLGNFSKSGYYDWNVVKFKDGRFSTMKCVTDIKLENEFEEAKGRYIVIDKSIKNLSIHEVFCDLVNADIDKEKGKIIKRGTFSDMESKLQELNQRYINCLYIMGALERDNQIVYDESTGEVIDMVDTDASPMAVTSRDTVSKLLGGDKDFISLINKANKFSMKILVDSLTRISSSRYHRKFRNILLNTLDEKGKITICYGSDGHSVSFEDSAILNYRKVESWDLLVQDVLNFTKKYKIDGMHLDNCQSWPQILQIDHDEMFRIDSDGQPAYSPLEILNGEIVVRDEDCGFWGSDLIDQYPNPILIKLTKSVWKELPNFIFVGECWSSQKFHNRHIVLTKSGVVPRMYTLPRALSSVFGRRIHRNGYIELCKPSPVSIFKEWLTENYQLLPEGSVVIQSSCGQVWPYPALLYGRGNWSVVDLLFSLPDVPMTFMDEINGEAYRVQITNVYESKDFPKPNKLPSNFKSKSFMNLEESDDVSESSDSYNTIQLTNNNSNTNGNSYNTMMSYSKSTNQLKSQKKKIAPKIKSLMSISGVSIKEIKNLKAKQDTIIKEIGPEFGFDLTKIRFHYDHRRKMRSMHESLRHGNLVYLNVYDANNDSHYHVLSFARHTPEETSIIAINFHSTSCSFKLDLKPLFPLFEYEINFNSICYIEDWITEEKGDFYFLREVISEGHARTLNPYSSICFGFQFIPYTKDNYKRTMEKSFSRMITDLNSGDNKYIDNYQTTIQLKYILEKHLHLEEFANWYYTTSEKLVKYKISMFQFFNKVQFFKIHDELCSTFFKYCYALKKLDINFKSLLLHVENVITSNRLGPIVFVTPEIGRWSTVGGLGVMVDELTQQLAGMGEDVIVITPYYDKNRKGETGYLSRDPVGFNYIGNIEVTLDQKYVFGVHYGNVNKVKIYFLHNSEAFPQAYSEGNNTYVLKQICLMSKASLELLCFLTTIPALVITNDWFTGLTAAYSKYGHFGETFRGTTFFHIVHNLEPTYEGRLYTSSSEGTLDHIHKLPSHILVDPYWKSKVINPSRCALLCSDQWGTVSPSYKKDLMQTSPLAPILNNHKRPFAFPNGIIRSQRLKILKDKIGMDHLEAKKQIQKKYFNFDDVDHSIPLFSFVGRITQQKGVILILEAAESIIQRSGGKINILLGGMGNIKDPYCISCVHKINYLKSKYPHNFWANPSEFFTDGPLVNIASDFGLMPSLFEPGGIVQHEFFIAGTPVLAFKTGGLKDTVFEYDWHSNKGNGIIFENHSINDFTGAVERAMALFKNEDKYEMCRINAFNSAIDLQEVANAWCKEFYRLRGKTFYNIQEADNFESLNLPLDAAEIWKSFHNFSISDYVFLKEKFLDSDTDDHNVHSSKNSVKSVIEGEARIPITFNYVSENNRKPSSVQVCGSFDKWQVRHPLTYDPLYSKWSITLKVKKGTHYYKYIVDGQWVISNAEKTMKDASGYINNFIAIG